LALSTRGRLFLLSGAAARLVDQVFENHLVEGLFRIEAVAKRGSRCPV
jgi:hypothetical protein